MHILGILIFSAALIVAIEVMRRTLAASGAKIVAAMAGEAPAPSRALTFINFQTPAHTTRPANDGARCPLSRRVSLPLAA